jgi:prepilin peptidase CpaA
VSLFASVALAALLGAAVWFDIRLRRIPNALTVAGLGVALLLRSVNGVDSLADGFAGAGFAVVLALIPFAFGLLGGGDVKLLGAVGGFMGAEHLFGALLAIALAGGVLALLEALRRRAVLVVVSRSFAAVKHLMLFGRFGMGLTLESPEAITVPYGVAIAVGSLAWWFTGMR